MLKHRGFPGRLPGTDYQFTLRRANPRGVTALVARERFPDRRPADKRADEARSGIILAKNPLSAAISMQGGCPGFLAAK